jgi:parallel beta-helix repeat protein
MRYYFIKRCFILAVILLLAASGFIHNAQSRSTDKTGTNPVVVPIPGEKLTEWEKVFPHSGTQDTRDITMTLDRTAFVITGRYYYPLLPFLMKVNRYGEEQWYYQYGPWSPYDTAWCLTAVNDGGFVMGGKVQHTSGNDEDDILVLKTNSSGIQSWQKEYDIAGYFDRMWDIEELADGSLVGCGTISQEPFYHDAGLVKMNAQGTKLWHRFYGQSGTTERARAMTATSDGGFLIGGLFGWNGDGNNLKSKLYVVKTDSDGNMEWSKTFGDPNVWNSANWVGETPCGDYIVAGRMGEASAGTDAWVLKLSAAGEIIWEKVFDGNYNDWFRGGVMKDDGSVILSGLTGSYSSNPGNGVSNRDGWIVKLHPLGHVLWQKVYGNSGVGEEFADIVGPSSDNKFVAAGYSGTNVYAVKFSEPTGNQVDNLDTGQSYSTIQAAINAAGSGHTLSVHSGTYSENVTVDKALTIIGENKDNTIIRGADTADALLVTASGVTVKGFTVTINYVGPYSYGPPWGGIKIESTAQNCVMEGNIILDCYRGFYLSGGGDTGNVIANNAVVNNVDDQLVQDYYSFWISGSSGNTIYGNTVYSSHKRGYGMYLGGSSNNAIFANDIYDNHTGIYLVSSSNDNRIHHNNFDNVTYNAYIENFLNPCTGNQFYLYLGVSSGGNYWSDHTCTDSNSDGVCDDPYTIPGGAGDHDLYPLAAQFEPLCGNIDGSPDLGMDIGDITYLISYLYHGGKEPVPPCSADVNGDGQIDDDDIDYLIAYMYQSGPPPVQNCCCK